MVVAGTTFSDHPHERIVGGQQVIDRIGLLLADLFDVYSVEVKDDILDVLDAKATDLDEEGEEADQAVYMAVVEYVKAHV